MFCYSPLKAKWQHPTSLENRMAAPGMGKYQGWQLRKLAPKICSFQIVT